MLLFETPIISGFTLLMSLLGLVLLVGGSIIVLMVKKKDTVAGIQVQRAEASEALVKTRDTELADANRKCDKCQEELDDTTAELRAQMGLNIGELMSYWERRGEELAEKERLQRRVRVLEIANKE